MHFTFSYSSQSNSIIFHGKYVKAAVFYFMTSVSYTICSHAPFPPQQTNMQVNLKATVTSTTAITIGKTPSSFSLPSSFSSGCWVSDGKWTEMEEYKQRQHSRTHIQLEPQAHSLYISEVLSWKTKQSICLILKQINNICYLKNPTFFPFIRERFLAPPTSILISVYAMNAKWLGRRKEKSSLT